MMQEYIRQELKQKFDADQNNCVTFALKYHGLADCIPDNPPDEWLDLLVAGLARRNFVKTLEPVTGNIALCKLRQKNTLGLRYDRRTIVFRAPRGVSYIRTMPIMEWRAG